MYIFRAIDRNPNGCRVAVGFAGFLLKVDKMRKNDLAKLQQLFN